MKTLADIRRENLLRLVAESGAGTEEGKQANLVRVTGKDRRQISAWSLGRKSISDRSARELETRCRKPRGWMDREGSLTSQDVDTESRRQSQPQRLDTDKMRDAMTLLRHLAELQGIPALTTDPMALAIAYDFVVEFDTPLSDSNVLDLTKRLAAKLRGNEDAAPERSKTA